MARPTLPASIFPGLLLAMSLALMGAPAAAAGGSGELKIGITQFPATLHPNIDSMLAKNYIRAMTARPLTVYDQEWQLICMLCTELPTIENGLAKREPLADGGEGIAVTYTLQPLSLIHI